VTSAPARRTGTLSVAVVGASGFVGRSLTAHLAGRVRSLSVVGRTVERLPSGPGIEARAVDVGDPAATAVALGGVDAAYYLVRAMAGGAGFAQRDRDLACSFATAAATAGVGRIVYLSGLGGVELSEHLSSRHEVGRILADSGVEVVELRAAVILGAGSISFEMLRYLTERLPVMICPRWVGTRIQPLGEVDLLAYLTESLGVEPGVYEIGTPDVTTYEDMMQAYAAIRGLRSRPIAKIPLLTPSLSAHWVDLVTPVDRSVSHALIESLRAEVVVTDPGPTAAAFEVEPVPVAEALRQAVDRQAAALPDRLFELDEGLADGVYTMHTEAAIGPGRAPDVAADLARVGGDLGWYGAPWAWRIRIVAGRLFGERLRIERPERPVVGATVDWWTIARRDPHRLVLATSGWFFGEGWLGYRVDGDQRDGAGGTEGPRVAQAAAFRPKGVPGFAYWRLLWPIHRLVFAVMARHRAQRGH